MSSYFWRQQFYYPFYVNDSLHTGRPAPKYVSYLGKVLPAATLGMLVVYCIRDVSLVSGNHGIPEFISIGVVAFLHFWKRKMLLSLASGTLLYMLLIRVLA